MIDQIIRKRYDEYRPTFITQRLENSAFERHIGERLVSRIQESQIVITADGTDYRPPNRPDLNDYRRNCRSRHERIPAQIPPVKFDPVPVAAAAPLRP